MNQPGAEPQAPRFAPRWAERRCGGPASSPCASQRRRSESNRRIEVLQTSALPLGYGAERDKLASYLQFLNPPRESPKPLPLPLGYGVVRVLTCQCPCRFSNRRGSTAHLLNLIGGKLGGSFFRCLTAVSPAPHVVVALVSRSQSCYPLRLAASLPDVRPHARRVLDVVPSQCLVDLGSERDALILRLLARSHILSLGWHSLTMLNCVI